MEHAEILIKGINEPMEKLWILFLELGCEWFAIGNCFTGFFCCFSGAVNCIRVLQHDTKPHIWLNFGNDVGKLQSCDNINGVRLVGEWFKEWNYTFRYTTLFSTLVNIDLWGIEEQDLGIGEFLFCRLPSLRFQSWVDEEDRANGQFLEDILYWGHGKFLNNFN